MTRNTLEPVKAPEVLIDGRQVVLDGVEVDRVDEIEVAGAPRRLDGLFSALKEQRLAWKTAHPDQDFPGVVAFYFDVRLSTVVVKSAFQTAAFAGYPNAMFVVRAVADPRRLVRLNCDAYVPLPSQAYSFTREPRLVLDADRARGALLFWQDAELALRPVQHRPIPLGDTQLAEKLGAIISQEWRLSGLHSAGSDMRFDQAVIRVANDLPFGIVTALLDAVYTPQRSFTYKTITEAVPSLNPTLMMDRPGEVFPSATHAPSLPPAVIQATIRESHDDFRQCYESGLASNARLEGKVVVRFRIDAEGTVTSPESTADTNLPSQEVVACVLAVYRRLRFPSPSKSVTVIYPLHFSPEP